MAHEIKEYNCSLAINGDELTLLYALICQQNQRQFKRKLKSVGVDFELITGLQKKLVPEIKNLEEFLKQDMVK